MNIFIAFANEDKTVRDKFLRQINLVKDREGWNVWSSREIKPGAKWDEEIRNRLKISEIIILLLSPDFFNSKYINDVEIPEIIDRHSKNECQIIPIIARLCHWKDTKLGEYAELGSIQALPVDEKPIVSRGWDNDDQPYFECVKGIREAIREFKQKKADEKAETERRIQEAEVLRLQEEERLRRESELRIQEVQRQEQLEREKERLRQIDEERRHKQEEDSLLVPHIEETKRPIKIKSDQNFNITKPLKSKSKISTYSLYSLLVVFLLLAIYKACQIQQEKQKKAQEQAEWEATIKKLYPEVGSNATDSSYVNRDSAVTTSKPITKPEVQSGRWEVRAGTWQHMDGARDRLEQVIRMGYTNAEIKKTSNGWAAVIVLRTNDKNKAIQVADQLEKRGLDAAVFKR